jgi:hypothetical protein
VQGDVSDLIAPAIGAFFRAVQYWVEGTGQGSIIRSATPILGERFLVCLSSTGEVRQCQSIAKLIWRPGCDAGDLKGGEPCQDKQSEQHLRNA